MIPNTVCRYSTLKEESKPPLLWASHSDFLAKTEKGEKTTLQWKIQTLPQAGIQD